MPREGGWGRVVAVFQPHRYTRTASLWRDFADAFVDADVLVLTDVYPAGEAPVPGVSGRLVLRAVLDAHPAARCDTCPGMPTWSRTDSQSPDRATCSSPSGRAISRRCPTCGSDEAAARVDRSGS